MTITAGSPAPELLAVSKCDPPEQFTCIIHSNGHHPRKEACFHPITRHRDSEQSPFGTL